MTTAAEAAHAFLAATSDAESRTAWAALVDACYVPQVGDRRGRARAAAERSARRVVERERALGAPVHAGRP